MPNETGDTQVAADSDHAAPETGPLEDLNRLQRELRHLLHDQLQLAALEVRLAAHNLLSMVAAAVSIGVLLLLVWTGLIGAIGMSLIEVGLKPALTLLVLAALTAGLAALLMVYIRRTSRTMGLPATLRALKPAAPGNNPGEES